MHIIDDLKEENYIIIQISYMNQYKMNNGNYKNVTVYMNIKIVYTKIK